MRSLFIDSAARRGLVNSIWRSTIACIASTLAMLLSLALIGDISAEVLIPLSFFFGAFFMAGLFNGVASWQYGRDRGYW